MPEVLRAGDDLEPLAAALKAGRLAIVPTDTVYGIVAAAHLPEACERLARAKGRDAAKPSAILCASLETVFTAVLPELLGRAGVRARRLLPGPVTVVVPNAGRRFRWLCGPTPERIGLRVPVLDDALAAVVDRIPALVATSANPAGGDDPVALDAVDPALLARTAVALDLGPIPGGGRPSTVVDITGPDPVVLREGPIDAAAIRERLAGT